MKTRNQISNARKKKFNVLIGVTGSVATIKLIELVQKLKSMFPQPYTNKSTGVSVEADIAIRIIMTRNSKHFIPKVELIKSLNNPSIEIYDDDDEWSSWSKMNDPVLHIELSKWADICLIAPLDANTMAKLANGLCDNLLTCTVRAWNVSKPLVYCPAMNVNMYNHPITKEHLCKLQSFRYLRVDCVEKRLACGDFGMGGMASTDTIAKKVVDTLIEPATNKISLPKPILIQQPTYPIISTSSDERDLPNQQQMHQKSSLKNSTPITNQILNRFRTNNQVSIHPVANNSPKISPTTTKRLSDAIMELASKRFRKTGNYIDLLRRTDKNHDRTTNGVHQEQTAVGITSLRNLKATEFENGALNYCLDDNNVPDYDNSGEEEISYELDPSGLLEQTMVTDDSVVLENDIRLNGPSRSLDYSQLQNNESPAKVDSATPLFNTSKFLALCYDKERGCFTCAICKHDYKNRKSMARHLKEQHVQGNIYQCKPCGVSYKRREKLIKHFRERHPDTPFPM